MSAKSDNVVALASYRKRRRQVYLAKHGARLEKFIAWFITANLGVDFLEVTQRYQEEQLRNSEMAWDYHDLRDMLEDAIEAAFGSQLFTEIAAQSWFDSRWISREEVMDRCISAFVLGHEQPGRTGHSR